MKFVLILAITTGLGAQVVKEPAKQTGRILNGVYARQGQFPFAAYLIVQKKEMKISCGGAILTSKYIVTAAHCIIDGISVKAFLGSIGRDTGKRYDITSENLISHEGFNNANSENDIGLIKLVNPINEFTNGIGRIDLEVSDNSLSGKEVFVMGWGRTIFDDISSKSRFLKYFSTDVLDQDKCRKEYKRFDSNICILVKDEKSIHRGDSGSPLVYYSEKKPILIGVASNMYPYVESPPFINVFTRLSHYRDWIALHTGEENEI